jgi:pyruvate dehydrogenase E1 component beta subunit
MRLRKSRISQAAIRDNDPVCVLENEMMYGVEFPISPGVADKDFVLPIGKAKVMKEGADVTLVSFSRMVGDCLKAAEELKEAGINAEARLPYLITAVLTSSPFRLYSPFTCL